MGQPLLDADVEPYMVAWSAISRRRGKFVQSLGMMGSVTLPDPLEHDLIRADGERRGYTWDDLDQFVAILVALDEHYVDLVHAKKNAEIERALAAAKSKR